MKGDDEKGAEEEDGGGRSEEPEEGKSDGCDGEKGPAGVGGTLSLGGGKSLEGECARE